MAFFISLFSIDLLCFKLHSRFFIRAWQRRITPCISTGEGLPVPQPPSEMRQLTPSMFLPLGHSRLLSDLCAGKNALYLPGLLSEITVRMALQCINRQWPKGVLLK